MGFFRFFRSNKDDASAKLAKDRLQVLIAHQRTGSGGPDYLPMLKQDILDVIKKYVSVGDDALSVQLDSQDNCDVLELNITLPEESAQPNQPSAEAKRRAMERRQAATKKVT
jgi:cell division topological specificity factor